jgi:hypothetical protein
LDNHCVDDDDVSLFDVVVVVKVLCCKDLVMMNGLMGLLLKRQLDAIERRKRWFMMHTEH